MTFKVIFNEYFPEYGWYGATNKKFFERLSDAWNFYLKLVNARKYVELWVIESSGKEYRLH